LQTVTPNRTKVLRAICSLKINDNWAQEFTKYTAWRSECYQNLQERAERELEMQTKVCNLIGKQPFQAATLKPYLEERLYQEFISLSEALRAKMAEVLALDDALSCPSCKWNWKGLNWNCTACKMPKGPKTL
jgi:hypothetical protein